MKTYNIRNMPEELHQRIKMKAAQESKPMQTLILELLEKGLK